MSIYYALLIYAPLCPSSANGWLSSEASTPCKRTTTTARSRVSPSIARAEPLMSCADANTGVSASPITKSHFMGDKLARSAYQFLEHPRSIEPNVRYANIRPQDRLTELAIARSTKALTAPKSFAADLEPVKSGRAHV